VSTLAVIGTFYRRPWAVPAIARAIREQTRHPDEVWLLYEDEADYDALADMADEMVGWASPHRRFDPPIDVHLEQVPVPAGVVPPSYQINVALEGTSADYIAYLTDDSIPLPTKYERMVAALDAGAGAVYCGQEFGRASGPDEWLAMHRGGSVRHATAPQPEPFCAVDHTQVAHRRSEDRWPTAWSEVQWSDGRFFQALVRRFGPLTPVPEVLDWTCQLPDGISARA
jgi:hypothetical protein